MQIAQLDHTYRVPFLNSNWNSVPSENVISHWQWKQMKKLIVQHAALSSPISSCVWLASLPASQSTRVDATGAPDFPLLQGPQDQLMGPPDGVLVRTQ